MKFATRARSLAIGGAALALAVGTIAPTAAFAEAPAAFNPNNASVFVGYNAPTVLGQVEQNADGSGFDLTTIIEAGELGYNALGFNTVDNYLYATKNGSNQLLQIAADGTITNLGSVAGLPANLNYNQGTFGLGADAGKYYVRGLDGTSQMNSVFAVEVNEPGFPVTTLELDGSVPNVSDIVYIDGYLWAYDGNTGDNFYRIAADTGEVASFDAAGLGIIAQPYGGQWQYGNGNLGITGNRTGDVYQISIADAASDSPVFTIMSQAKGQPTANNDAASIKGLPADLAIAETGDELAVPGEAYSYTITVTNTGNVDLSDITVTEGSFSGAGKMSAIDCSAAPVVLEPAASATCTASYTVVAADLTGAPITNTATASATGPDGPVVSNVSMVEVTTVKPVPPVKPTDPQKPTDPKTLPNTGSNGEGLLGYAAAALLVLGAGTMLLRRKRAA